jgi:HD-GYP domain-containing protein (c-di-GMP phosphodiesterase class II)
VTSAAPSLVPARPAAQLDPAVNELIEKARGSVSRRLRGRGLASALVLGGAFLVTASALAALVPSSRTLDPTTAALLVLAYAGLSRVEFEVRTGLAIPTGLVFVPMLFLVPLGTVPLLVCAGSLLSRAVDVALAHVPPDRLLLAPVYSWHVVGPVAVLALHGERLPRLADWPWYVAALLAQFAFDFAFSGGREWFAKGVALASQLPFMGWAFLVDAALAPVGLLAALAAVDNRSAVALVLPLVGLLTMFARERQVRIDHALELSHAYRGTAFLLGDVVEADDAYTGSHSRDVVALVRDVCDRLELDAHDRRDAEFAALLHDVGKIRIPSEIIRKPGKLTPGERAVIETHTVEGERLLAQVGGILGNVGRIVRSCHEDWDGTGYPDRLRGEEIPLVARIIRCCDAFSAMTTDRPYRRARPVSEALAELRRCAGTDFDPAVVEALGASISES